MPTWKELLRLARRWAGAWQKPFNPIDASLVRVSERIDWFDTAHARLNKARQAGLKLVLPQLLEGVQGALRAVHDVAAEVMETLVPNTESPVTTVMLVRELQQLEAEFGELEFNDEDEEADTLCVTTEPITLEGIALGVFRIRLHLERLARRCDSSCFAIIALDPNPAASNEGVTHPHVQDQELCAGEARVPIQKALAQGRLADAFCLIRGVLENYNPRSPHVGLDRWGGSSCADCGRAMDSDDSHYCEGCDQDYCDDCFSSCCVCENSRCNGCLRDCPVCDYHCCGNCIRTSAHSGAECCSDCLRACAQCEAEITSNEIDSETQLCPTCQAQHDETADEAAEETTAEAVSAEPSDLETNHAECLEPVGAAA